MPFMEMHVTRKASACFHAIFVHRMCLGPAFPLPASLGTAPFKPLHLQPVKFSAKARSLHGHTNANHATAAHQTA